MAAHTNARMHPCTGLLSLTQQEEFPKPNIVEPSIMFCPEPPCTCMIAAFKLLPGTGNVECHMLHTAPGWLQWHADTAMDDFLHRKHGLICPCYVEPSSKWSCRIGLTKDKGSASKEQSLHSVLKKVRPPVGCEANCRNDLAVSKLRAIIDFCDTGRSVSCAANDSSIAISKQLLLAVVCVVCRAYL